MRCEERQRRATKPPPPDCPPATDLPDTATTPAALLTEVRTARESANRAEVAILELAVEWAHAHPSPSAAHENWRVRVEDDLDDTPPDFTCDEDADDYGIPPVAWHATTPFAAANAMSTTAGRALIRDALILCHRMPLIWA